MNSFACRMAVCLGVCFGAGNMTASAQEGLPSWVYDAVSVLDDEGYITLAGHHPKDLTRAELAEIVAQGLHEIDRIQQGTLADEYGRITSLAMRDEVHVKLYREQERYALKSYEAAQSDARKAEELLARQSMRGENRLEVMQPLQERAANASRRLQFSARDYALAKTRRQKRELALVKMRERQQTIFASLAGETDASSSAPADPLVEPQVLVLAARLRSAFIEELAETGYTDRENAEQQLYASVPLPEAKAPRVKVDAEVRIDASRSAGLERGDSRSRMRARIYPDYDIDGNWHAAGMVEYEKRLTGGGDDRDGRLKLDRYYLTGSLGAVQTTVGVFGATMAEGNIYDSKFRGVRFSTGAPITYAAKYGRIDRARTVANLTASYDAKTYQVEAGLYRFDRISNATRNIYMANFRTPVGVFDFGAMVLHGRDHAAGNGTGYVFTLEHGGASAWRPGSSSYFLKYYRQPSSTYVSHTMNGAADYMSHDTAVRGPARGGFCGWGAGWSYTVKKDLNFSIEYFHLWDLQTHERSRTLWGALTGYFKNYED